MKLAALVTLRAPLGILGLARTELTKVLGGPGNDVGKKLHFDASERLA